MAAPKSYIYKAGDVIDHTATTDITGGAPTQIGDSGLVGLPQLDIDTGYSDSMTIGGIIAVEAAAAVGNVGDNVWFDSNGSPYGGTASSGAATTVASSGDFWLGTLAVAKGATDSYAYVFLNRANPAMPAWQNRIHQITAVNLTLDVEDSGKVIHNATDEVVITLPVTATGQSVEFIIQCDAADTTVATSINPNGDDKIQGMNIAGTNDKDLINTKATQNRGDYVILQGGHADGYCIVEKRGVWATETP